MKFLEYVISFTNFHTKVDGFEAHHYGFTLFTVFSFGVNYMPLKHATRFTFYVRLFNKLEFEGAIVLWVNPTLDREMVHMYDA